MQRAYRLRSSAEFQRARSGRRSWAHPLLVLYAAPNDLGHPRVGVSVSRRIGKAAVRNRVRRRIREALRQRLSSLVTCHDLVFVARSPSAAANWPALCQAVDELLRRARLVQRAAARTEA